MPPPWDSVAKFLVEHAWGTTGTVLALLCAAIATYARDQVRAGTNWALAPITRTLPWNRGSSDAATNSRPPLISELTLVDVFLLDVTGTVARYQKTSCYVADREVASYQEGVTADGRADKFSTMRGTLVATTREHGFYLSRIDLGAVLQKGSRLTNTYVADLHGCFTEPEEQWTQEIIYPTKHLSLRIHFPDGGTPKSITCKIKEGSIEKSASASADLVELFGRKSIVWEVQEPKLGEILKIEWMW